MNKTVALACSAVLGVILGQLAASPVASHTGATFTPTSIPASSRTTTFLDTRLPVETAGQRNAKNQAKSYLRYSAFSRKGLIDQLKFEGYSTKDATYGVDANKVNWNLQAVKKAKSYLSNSAFSRTGLIDQLKFEGFTNSQAKYGVDKNKVNWNTQAVKKAKSYLRYSSFSRSGLIEQLVFEGFTRAQATYGVKKAGL